MRCDALTADAGLRRARELLGLADPPTAIVAANDAQAFGVLQAIAERGLRSPDDVSVTGFDDLPIATWATPPLTTVRQPLAAMAATAFWMLTSGARPGPPPGAKSSPATSNWKPPSSSATAPPRPAKAAMARSTETAAPGRNGSRRSHECDRRDCCDCGSGEADVQDEVTEAQVQ